MEAMPELEELKVSVKWRQLLSVNFETLDLDAPAEEHLQSLFEMMGPN